MESQHKVQHKDKSNINSHQKKDRPKRITTMKKREARRS
jgi:hypothetical protein